MKEEGKVDRMAVCLPATSPASLSHSTLRWDCKREGCACERKRPMGFSYSSSEGKQTSGKKVELQLRHYAEGREMAETPLPF